MAFKENLDGYIDGLLKSREENRFSDGKTCCGMPDKKTIIKIIDDIRALLFPAHFGNANGGKYTERYITGSLMLEIYTELKKQIALAYTYENSISGIGCGEASDTEEKAEKAVTEFFRALPEIYKLLTMDIEAAFDGDPAAEDKDIIVFSYPCMLAIIVHRVAHIFYEMKVPLIPRIMSEYAHSETGIDINPGAKIGKYFFIDHGTGVVIGETTEIGDHVKIYQGVTLGALSTRDGQKLRFVKRHPTIEDNVTIYSGASVLGGKTVIGENAVIGSNAFITSSIPKNARVMMKIPELDIKVKNDKTE